PLQYFFSLGLRRAPTSTLFPYTTLFRSIGAALSHFARGIGAARVSDTAQARLAVAALAAIEADMTRRGDNDWARVVAIKRQLVRSEEHTSELQSRSDLVCRLLLEKKNYD